MSPKYTFRDLIVWRKAIELSKTIYHTTQALPDTERYGLISQMRRAAVSIPSNIAEGNARQTTRDFLKFLSIARGSLAELETQIIIADELQLLSPPAALFKQIQEVRRLLQALMNSLRGKQEG